MASTRHRASAASRSSADACNARWHPCLQRGHAVAHNEDSLVFNGVVIMVTTRTVSGEGGSRDPLLSIRVLARALHVPRRRLVELEDDRVIKFQWRRFGQWMGRVGRMGWFVDTPLYDCTEAGKLIGVCGCTVRRWRDAGRVKTRKVGCYRRRRITPRDVFRLKREHDLVTAKVRPPKLEEFVRRYAAEREDPHGR